MIRIGKLGATLLCLSYLTSCLLFYELGCDSTPTSIIRDESFRRVGNADNNGTWRFDSITTTTTTVLDDTLERAYVASSAKMLHHIHHDNVDEDDDVAAVMHRIRILNDCSSSPDCLTIANLLVLPMPMLITAYFAGQGMGRLIEHTTSTCLNAASVGRGCLIDMTSKHISTNTLNRDTWYTFRSFIRVSVDVNIDTIANHYKQWGEDTNHHNERLRPLLLPRETVEEAQYAISLLPNFAHGQWTQKDLQNSPNFTFVLPLGDENVTHDVVRTIINNPHLLVLSPNWGTAWFAKKDVIWPSLLHNNKDNDDNDDDDDDQQNKILTSRLESYMQNYIYQPTSLLQGLYQEYKHIVMDGGNSHDEKSIENNDYTSYGAVHLRFFFLSQKYKSTKTKKEDVLGYEQAVYQLGIDLYNCLRHYQNVSSIDRWWIITDDLDRGMNITNQVREMEATRILSTKKKVTGNKLKLYTDDSSRINNEKEGDENVNTIDKTGRDTITQILLNRHSRMGGRGHSNNKESRAPLGHMAMADSMIDWMVLHESKVAIVMNGSFGASGAKGNGKYYMNDVPDNLCSGLRVFRTLPNKKR